MGHFIWVIENFNLHIEFIERIITTHFSSPDMYPEVSTYTKPNGGYDTCTAWSTVNSLNLQTAVGAAFGSFIAPEANLCTAQGDEDMYCLNDSGEKRYCHCETVSANYGSL